MLKKTFRSKLLRNALGAIAIITALSGCGLKNSKGELTGVPGRKPWYHPQPYGTVYVPTGTFQMGQADQDILASMSARPKQISIAAFFMDDTEITNNEFRQFVFWVRDSISHKTIGDVTTNEAGEERIDWSKKIDYSDPTTQETLKPLMYSEQDKVGYINSFDTRKLRFKYKTFDLQEAAKLQYKLKPVARKTFIKEWDAEVYPDTLAFIRDFTYSFNDPMAQTYFMHPGYDDYPVVGVSWHQANAFCWWRTNYINAYYLDNGDPEVDPFHLPTEAQWEYAARGGRRFSPYPWGGPYTRNSRGCFLANFKPLRGDYISDGGFYPVKATSYFPNDYGLYCMAGNVAEWTSSAFDPSIYQMEHDKNSDYYYNAKDEEAPSMKRKVIRGGSWKDTKFYIQVSTRSSEYQDTAKSYIGFRCVQEYLGRSINDR
jgi:gliding motility-associated lipoprotein GldK